MQAVPWMCAAASSLGAAPPNVTLAELLEGARLTHLAAKLRSSTPQSMRQLMGTAGKTAFVASLKALGIKDSEERRALLSALVNVNKRSSSSGQQNAPTAPSTNAQRAGASPSTPPTPLRSATARSRSTSKRPAASPLIPPSSASKYQLRCVQNAGV